MERQKTAVEWLITEIEDLITIETFQKWKGIKEQALALEREQIKEAFKDGFSTSLFEIDKSDEQYYTTKYGKQ